MEKGKALSLYTKYFVDRDFERLELFLIIGEKFRIKSALYPGSFVHITPSFVFPKVVYVDSYKKANDFFSDPSVVDFISKNKIYKKKPSISFHFKDYMKDIGEPRESFDLLISQYAGFVSQYCKKYLKIGGLLLANNSHGDASMASIDKSYEFIGVLNKKKDKYSFSDKNLELYFIPKKPVEITKDYLKKIQRGVGYTKSATNYLFRRVR